MLSFDEASAILRAAAAPLPPAMVPIAEAEGLVLAEDVTARIDSPRADVSAMDGYAVREADLPGPFGRIGVSSAGTPSTASLGPGETLRIFTGAHLPDGADRVLVQEIVEADGDMVRLVGEYGDNRHVRHQGSDYAAGDILLRAGTLISPNTIVLLAGADRAEVTAVRRPRVAVLATGDELAPPGTALETPGSLPESVSFGVAALARAWGGDVTDRLSVKDDAAAIARMAAEAFKTCDVLTIIGGASVGERDFAKSALGDGGMDLLFSKAAIRPGKPIWVAADRRGKYLVGLPGNPTSAMVTARLFLAPLLHALAGKDYDSALSWEERRLSAPLPAPGDREHFARGISEEGTVRPIENQQSSSQATLAQANVLIRQAANGDPVAAGECALCLPF